MNGERPQARTLFEQLAPLSASERAAALNELRNADATLLDEVASLLKFHDRDGQILDTPALAPGSGRAEHSGPIPEKIGAFRIIRLLGTGGMGVVYEAEQEYPSRRVALKLVRPGLVSTDLMRRFSHEAQALARLQHTGIAKVYEAGVDAALAQPYIAMELIEGVPLTDRALLASLDVRAKLRILAQVCEAVEHAHRRGVVHRDLKPANILVTPSGDPKVLDFGVARLADAPGGTLSTSAGQVIGTLTYMSPEQASGGGADERSDVYALGAMMYELLAGAPPLDVGTAPLPEAMRIIAAQEPAPLGIADRRFRGDLETIARRALEKDPKARYQHAADLREDIRRYLESEPILARPPSTAYQLVKFARRNRVAVTAITIIMAALALGIAGTSWQAVRATRESERASEEAALSRQTVEFMRRLLRGAHPSRAQGRELTVREVVDAAAKDLKDNPPTSPTLAVSANMELAYVYSGIGRHDEGIEFAQRALELSEKLYGRASEKTIEAACTLGGVYMDSGQDAKLREFIRPWMAVAENTFGREHESSLWTINLYAQSAVGPEELAESEELQRWLLSVRRRINGPQDRKTHVVMSNLAVILTQNGKAEEGLALAQEVLALREKYYGPMHPETLLAGLNAATAAFHMGRHEEAVTSFEALIPKYDTVYTRGHINSLRPRTNLGMCYLTMGRYNAGARVLRESYFICLDARGPTAPQTLQFHGSMATCLIHAKRYDEAAAAITLLYDRCREAFGESDERTVQVITLWYDYHEARGETDLMNEAVAKLKGTPYDPTTAEHHQPAPLIDGPEADPDPPPLR